MIQSSEAFWSDYRRLVARLMPPLAPGDGVPESEIAAAEARLGMNLPTLLQEFYALAGKREDINHSFEHLVSVEELQLDGGMLVFYEENQDVTFWAVKSDDTAADPAIFRAFNEENLDWEPDSELLSEFLVAMFVLQAVNGGMAYSGIGDANPERVTNARADWDRIELRRPWGHKILMRDGQALFVDGSAGEEAFGGGRTRKDFLAVEEAFQVTWNYSTLDDEPNEELNEEDEDA